MQIDRRLRKLLTFFFPLLFIAYAGGSILFTHTHVVDGVVIVHSHPGKTGHSHSQQGLETIFGLSHFAVPDGVLPSYLLSPLFVFLTALLLPDLPVHALSGRSRANGRRAPPVFLP